MNKKEEKKLEKLLKYDGLAEAEKDTGSSYKESPFTREMGLQNHLEHVVKKEEALLAADDTILNNDLGRYLEIAEDIGFRPVLEVPFVGHPVGSEKTYKERLFVLWRDGILLVFDTYLEERVNGGNFYYNWAPKDIKEAFHYTSTGGYDQRDPWIWSGHHDCREALRFHIRRLEENGQILPVWEKQPFMWLLHYMDRKTKDYDYQAINKARISKLPKEIQAAIRGK